MKPGISILITLLCFSLTTAIAQTTLPYSTGFDNATQKNGWQMFRKGATGTYQWNYSTVEPYSGTDCLYHDYPVGGTTVTDDWYVSPPFSLTTGGKLDSIRHSFSGFGTPATGDTLAIYVLTGNADPALATSKVLLHDFRGTAYNNDNTWRQTTNLTLPPSASPCYIAIRYKTINNWITVKFDNIRLHGNATTSIGEANFKKGLIRVFPNPANEQLTVLTKEGVKEISITDMSGRQVYKNVFSEKIDLSGFKSGMYLLTCVMKSGEMDTRFFVKN